VNTYWIGNTIWGHLSAFFLAETNKTKWQNNYWQNNKKNDGLNTNNL